MSIARVDVSNYLDTQFAAMLPIVGQAADDDSPEGYGPDVDDALRKLGYTEANLETASVIDSLRDAIYALASYYTARRIWIRLGDRVNHTIGVTIYDFKDQRYAAHAVMLQAADMCGLLGYSVDGRVVKTKASFSVF